MIKEVGTDIGSLAPQVDQLKGIKLESLTIPEIKEHLVNGKKVAKAIDVDIKKIDEIWDGLVLKR